MWLKIGFGNFFLPLANIYKQLSKKQSIHRYQPSGICMMCRKKLQEKGDKNIWRDSYYFPLHVLYMGNEYLVNKGIAKFYVSESK